ncbi:hypothetical protein MTR_7g069990 [Medicago truncatula]|uniref:Uncharacterized protein n=1 Tax=Medicago truncatula TaxID=3880 RepID=G7KT77_MEDTR|nr:hypothetical protein MTR_7g069990 [Medicago truncatula]
MEQWLESGNEKNMKMLKKKNIAPAGNRTRVCTVAGYYSTTRPLVLLMLRRFYSTYLKHPRIQPLKWFWFLKSIKW